jgi:hypothetical protein
MFPALMRNISNTTSREVVVSGDLNVDRSSETTSQFIRGGDDANTLKGGSGNDIFETGTIGITIAIYDKYMISKSGRI